MESALAPEKEEMLNEARSALTRYISSHPDHTTHCVVTLSQFRCFTGRLAITLEQISAFL